MLQQADIAINGERPWDVKVRDPRFFETVFAGGSLGLGESYMRGWWECKALNQFFFPVAAAGT
jgi:cyclopropane-fatty-acyl-phospholipid synthase